MRPLSTPAARFAVRTARLPRPASPIGRCKERTLIVNSGILAAILAVAYLVLFIWLGIRTLRHGHWVMFIIGIFIPLFWIIGALIPRRR